MFLLDIALESDGEVEDLSQLSGYLCVVILIFGLRLQGVLQVDYPVHLV